MMKFLEKSLRFVLLTTFLKKAKNELTEKFIFQNRSNELRRRVDT